MSVIQDHDSAMISHLHEIVRALSHDQGLLFPYALESMTVSALPSSVQKILFSIPEVHQFFVLVGQANLLGLPQPHPPSLIATRTSAAQKLERTLEGSSRAVSRGIIGMMAKADLPFSPFKANSDFGFDPYLDADGLRDSQRTREEHRNEVHGTLLPEWCAHVKEYIEFLDVLRWFEDTYPPDSATTKQAQRFEGVYYDAVCGRGDDYFGLARADDGTTDESNISEISDSTSVRHTSDTISPTARDTEVTHAITFAFQHLHSTYQKISAEREARVAQVVGDTLSPLGLEVSAW